MLLFVLVIGVALAYRDIHVELQAGTHLGSSGDVAIELGESLAELSTPLFWDWLDGVSSSDTHEELYRKAISGLTSDQASIVDLTLSSRYYMGHANLFTIPVECSGIALATPSSADPQCFGEESVPALAGNETHTVYSTDHVHPSCSSNDLPAAILYAHPQSIGFARNHEMLSRHCKEGSLKYIFRPIASLGQSVVPSIQGFGVHLDVKNTEYRVTNDLTIHAFDDESTMRRNECSRIAPGFFFIEDALEEYPGHAEDLYSFRQSLFHPVSTAAEDIENLGLQTVQSILASKTGVSKLLLLRELTQDFPMHASMLQQLPVKPSLRRSVKQLQNRLRPGTNAISINKIALDPKTLDSFALIELLKSEAKFTSTLEHAGYTSSLVTQLMALPAPAEQTEVRLDCRSDTILWLNDIEKDPEYASWDPRLASLLSQGWPNQLRYVRKNLYELILIIDPIQVKDLTLLDVACSFLEKYAPFRVGVLFGHNPRESSHEKLLSTAVSKVFRYIHSQFSPEEASTFLRRLLQESSRSSDTISRHSVLSTLSNVLRSVSSEYKAEALIESLLLVDDPIHKHRHFLQGHVDDSLEFISSSGLDNQAFPHVFFNGEDSFVEGLLDFAGFREGIIPKLLQRQQEYQRDTYTQVISETTALQSYIYGGPGTVRRINKDIVKPLSDREYIAMEELPVDQYIYTDSESDSVIGTFVVKIDLASPSGLAVATSALEFVNSADSNIRLAFLFDNQDCGLSKLLTKLIAEKVLPFKIIKILGTVQKAMELGDDWNIALSNSYSAYSNLDGVVVPSSSFNSGHASFIYFNGRLVDLGSCDNGIAFELLDFNLLYQFEMDSMGSSIQEVIGGNDHLNPAFAYIALATRFSEFPNRMDLEELLAEGPIIRVPSDQSHLSVSAIVDPLTTVGQKLSTFLVELATTLQADVSVLLFPEVRVSELPLNRFYRYSLSPKIKFRNGDLKLASGVTFSNIASGHTLTMGLETPQPWVVESHISPFDLDNIELASSLPSGISGDFPVVYRLEHILVAGQCIDESSRKPAAGLQLDLSSTHYLEDFQDSYDDTLVMENLGYFQLQGSFGIWNLAISSMHGHDSVFGITSTHNPIILSKLTPKSTLVHVGHLSGKEGISIEDIVDPSTDSSTGVWNRVSGLFSSVSGVVAPVSEPEMIHVFSLASGHLYERMMRIMMLSVVKERYRQQQITGDGIGVKFWFMHEFLSPAFKASVGAYVDELSSEYCHVEVQLLSYKWPEWLRQQSEKQRMIWGYKILFLDVLFPLKLDRIIFVDADQIVRSDLKELWDMDLHGNVYGYTPFCDSNKETEGFRFWKQGYWQSHLAGKPYHISALYVVDLKLFRRTRSGDRLRVIYDNLSRDPNSCMCDKLYCFH